MVEVASCFRILFGSRVYSRYLKRCKHNSGQCMLVSNYQLDAVVWSIIVFRLSVSRPVEQPGLLCAGQGRAQFFSFTGNGGILKLWPGKVPLYSATCCDGIAVHSGTQVGVDPKLVQYIIIMGKWSHFKCSTMDLKTVRHWDEVYTHSLILESIHCLNHSLVRSWHSLRPVLQARLMAFTWLYLERGRNKSKGLVFTVR